MITYIRLIATALVVFSVTATAHISDSENLVVLASPLSIESTDIDYTDLVKPKTITLGFGSALKLKYEIDEIIYGSSKSNEITFYDFERSSGFPKYVTEGIIYLFLVRRNNNYILSNIGLLKSSGEELIVCGSMLNPYAEDGSINAPKYKKTNACNSSVELEKLKEYFSKFDFDKKTYRKETLLR